MFIIPSIDLSMKLSLSEVFVSNIIVTMVISNKSCCKHVLFTNLSDFISTTTRVTSVKSKKFLFCSFSVAKFGIAPQFPGRAHICHKYHKLYLWRKNCHVEKFWEILEKFWEILGNFEKFWEILPQFTHFHVEKNWAQEVHLWRKNDKYEVWLER